MKLQERISNLIDTQELGFQIQQALANRESASVPPPGLSPGPKYGRVRSVQSHINIRSAPYFGNNIIGTLPLGSTVEIIGEAGDFYRLSFPGYTAAYGLKTKIQVIDSLLPDGAASGTPVNLAVLTTAAYFLLR